MLAASRAFGGPKRSGAAEKSNASDGRRGRAEGEEEEEEEGEEEGRDGAEEETGQRRPSCAAHILPCYVHHEGPVNASERFWAPHILGPENDSESGDKGELVF